MSDLYARIPTSARKTVPTARGFKSTGIEAEVCSWDGKIVSKIKWSEKQQQFRFSVWMAPHHGSGDELMLATGVVGDAESALTTCTPSWKDHVDVKY